MNWNSYEQLAGTKAGSRCTCRATLAFRERSGNTLKPLVSANFSPPTTSASGRKHPRPRAAAGQELSFVSLHLCVGQLDQVRLDFKMDCSSELWEFAPAEGADRVVFLQTATGPAWHVVLAAPEATCACRPPEERKKLSRGGIFPFCPWVILSGLDAEPCVSQPYG